MVCMRYAYETNIKNLIEKGAKENTPINPIINGVMKFIIFINFL